MLAPAMRRLPSVAPLCLLAILCTASAGACGSSDDLSMACGPTASFLAPRCFGGVVADELARPLTRIGYACAVARGVEHTAINCTPPEPAGAPLALRAQIDVRGRRSAWIDATACGTPRASQVQALFEAVAVAPFPRDDPHARRARSWTDASLDRRSHSTMIAGYLYSAGIALGDCQGLRVMA